ncbi:glycoside hydrolase family 5 protein [Daldinia caldariorum]|uniref:glycoside hydrolase family 5 protein n=1 Tax=Daldinia caldariorum TaxID=326644 RepID=UPI002008309C|nr:glycoside hydrolase family 5 protein [Daldinia caldariorum]KAI1464812.1 glycoside hydrolase family 5 protein [Daldinia caldariorum]
MANCVWRYWLPVCLAINGVFASSNIPRATWPNGPFLTSGRWIHDAAGSTVTYVGVNWPGSLDTMIPEGLQYQSIQSIVSKIKSLGMNTIRLTYATEMIDQYYDNGETDITIQKALTDVLGQDSGRVVYHKIITNNPSFSEKTTRLQVYDAIAAECAKQEIYVHLDNHISKAGWCCSPLDGNSWWGDEFFNIDNWTRGLSFMATHGKSWPSLTSMSLRNELRIPLNNVTFASSAYSWERWYTYVKQGSSAIHRANGDVLIFLSGLNSDQDLSPIVNGTALTPGSATFNQDDFSGFANKLVLELHAYDNIFGSGPSNCTAVEAKLFNAGFKALTDEAKNRFPVVLTEFGLLQNNEAKQDPYISCLLDYVPSANAGWMIWEIGGSYYIREGTQDQDESWGLLTHDWSDWRSPDFANNALAPAAKRTFTIDQNSENNISPHTANGGEKSRGTRMAAMRASALFDVPLWLIVAILVVSVSVLE